MPKSPNQKLKLLYLMTMLLENTDEDHAVSVAEMIEYLAKHDISAERKSIYSDLEALQRFGLDIVQIKGASTRYYVASRDFEMPELKLLVDSVQSSRFITQKKTLQLIKKIEGLASKYDAQLLQRQVYVQNRVKTMNESVYYNVDEVSAAISADRQIKFKYFDYSITKQRKFRKDGEFYTVSPFALTWDHENYYMLAYDAAAGRIKHYRVDRMTSISTEQRRRQGAEEFAKIDMSAYSNKVFSMFSGDEQTVRLRFASRLASAVIDRFGQDVTIIPDGEEDCFTITVPVSVSPQFFAWLFGFGDEVELLYPESVRRQYRRQLESVAKMYGEAGK